MSRRMRWYGFVVVIAAFSMNGCHTCDWTAFLSPANLSKEITFVMDNSARFAQDAADPLANVAPGEVRDDLSQLSGCWGTSYASTFVTPFLGYETYSLDPTTGTFRYHVFQTPSAYIEDTAEYVVTSPNTITLRNLTRVVHGDKEPFLTKGPITVLVTLEGDRMKIAYLSTLGNFLDGSTGEPDELRVPLVFRRFDCPE